MSEPMRLDELTLERDALNIFVFGPGYGEAIVIDLPGPGWLVIDGAGRDRAFPAHDVLEHHLGDDFIAAMLLTHPHEDHYRGMRELIDHETIGPKLRRVGCVRALVEDREATAESDVLTDVGAAKTLLERVKSWWAEHPDGRLELATGPLELGSEAVTAKVLAPSQETIATFLGAEGRSSRIRTRANEISLVLELCFGEGRYLFTGDLPMPQWDAILTAEEELDRHDYLKLPHHGSEGAQPQGLLRSRTSAPRTWVLTPFNRGRAATRPPTHSGLGSLLCHEQKIHMTAFPTAWRQTRPVAESLRLSQLEQTPVRPSSVPLTGRRIAPRGVDPQLEPRDCYWLFCFDEKGQLTRSARGAVATTIVADPPL